MPDFGLGSSPVAERKFGRLDGVGRGAFAGAWCGRNDAVAGKDFKGEVVVGLGAAGFGVVKRDGFAVAGGFGEPDVAGDDGFEQLVAEECFEVFGDLLGEIGAVVEHREQDAFERKGRVEGCGDAVEGGHEFGDAFEGEVFGLHRDEQAICGDQSIEGEEVERGRAVEDDEWVFGADGLKGVAEAELAALGGDQLEVGADHVAGAGDETEVGNFGGECGLVGGRLIEENVVDGQPGLIVGRGAAKAHAAGGVGLGVAVDEEGGDAFEGEGGREVDGGGRFADSALLIDDSDDLGHAKARVAEERVFHVERLGWRACSPWNST